MGKNIQTVKPVDADGDALSIDADGRLETTPSAHVSPTILVEDVVISSAGSTNNTVIAAPGSGLRIVLVGIVSTTDVAVDLIYHWGTTASDVVLRYNYIADGGVAYHWGAYGPKGGDNEALTVDHAITATYTTTVYYYTEAV